MRDFLTRFGLVDFLAYLFPGIATIGAVWTIVALLAGTPIVVKLEITHVLLLLVAAYIVSVVLAGPCEHLRHFFCWAFHRRAIKSRECLAICAFPAEVSAAFNQVFGGAPGSDGWEEKHFHLVRALVTEYLPRLADEAARQNVMLMFRQYLYAPVLLWILAGVLRTLRGNQRPPMPGLIAVGVVGLGFAALLSLTVRLSMNRQREARIVCNALIFGTRTGAFRSGSTNPPLSGGAA